MAGAIRLAPAAAALFFVLGVAAAGTIPQTETAGRPDTDPDTLTATVRYVHPERGGIDVIRGFHLALQLQYFLVTDDTRIERQERAVEMEDLQPGDLVRIDYRETEGGWVADTIAVLRRGEEGGRP